MKTHENGKTIRLTLLLGAGFAGGTGVTSFSGTRFFLFSVVTGFFGTLSGELDISGGTFQDEGGPVAVPLAGCWANPWFPAS